MGDPKKLTNKYAGPRRLFDKNRIIEENKLQNGYSLKNKKELWMAKSALTRIRANARALLAETGEQRALRENELLESLYRKGFAPKGATLDDVLSLQVESLLERRLQTQVWKLGMAGTTSQARQFIVHGHVQINGKVVDSPGYMLTAGEESQIKFTGSPMMLPQPKEKKASKEEMLKEAGAAAAEATAKPEAMELKV